MSFWTPIRLGLLAGGGGRWTPASFGSDLLAWWDADHSGLITVDGSNRVASWKDFKNAYDLTQGTDAAKPVRSATSFNSRPGVTFDGSDDMLSLESVPLPTAGNAAEVWLLVDQQSAGTAVIFGYGGATGNTSRSFTHAVSGVSRARMNIGNGSTQGIVTDTTTTFSGRHLVRCVVTATGIAIAVDGGALPAETAFVPNTGSTRTRMGANTSGTSPFTGVVAAVVVTNLLSAANATLLAAWGNARR